MSVQETTREIFKSILTEGLTLNKLKQSVITANDEYGDDADGFVGCVSDLINNHDICDCDGNVDTLYVEDYLTSYGY